MTKETELVTKMTEETKTKPRNGGSMGLISIILGAGGIFLSYFLIFLYLADILAAETAAAQECRLTAPFFIPAFAVVGIVGGMLWLTAGVGFFQRKGWAYSIAVIAVIITLFSSFWPNIPAMESGVVVPGPWFLIFFPNLLVYFILVGRRGKEPGTKALLGLIIGMAFILNFINGIAATTRMMNRLPDISLPTPDYSQAFMYMLTMPTNMIASILFGYTAIGLFLAKRKHIVRTTGLAGVFLAISAGFPLAFYSMFFSGEFGFSMFIMGPVVSLVAGLIIIPSKMWNKIMRITE